MGVPPHPKTTSRENTTPHIGRPDAQAKNLPYWAFLVILCHSLTLVIFGNKTKSMLIYDNVKIRPFKNF